MQRLKLALSVSPSAPCALTSLNLAIGRFQVQS